MKELFLVRHAEASSLSPTGQDADRPLTARGKQDLTLATAKLQSCGLTSELIVSSTAVRAFSTAQGIACAFGLIEERIRVSPELYLAPPNVILRVIQDLDEETDAAVLVGHNPGMLEVFRGFSAKMGIAGRNNFPTLGILRLTLQVESWAMTDWNSAIHLDWMWPEF